MTRRKTKKKSGGFFSRFRSGTKKRTSSEPSNWKLRLTIAGIIAGWTLAAAGLCVGFYYLRGYIHQNGTDLAATGPIELVNAPDWLEQEWLRAITAAAGGSHFALDEASAQQVAENLRRLSWMQDVRAQTTPGKIKVTAQYRKPAARAQTGSDQWVYLDTQNVVLDALPLEKVNLVEIRGLSGRTIPPPGNAYHSEAAAAAIQLLGILKRMDRECCPEKPLLHEIAYIDVTDFSARQTEKPNIVLAAHDETLIHWGAAYGQAVNFAEADEKEKLIKLYNFYQQNDYTLQGKVKFIELRTPRTALPRPR